MTSSPLRFGLIGTGRIGQVHAATIAALPDAELTVACDTFIDGAIRLTESLGGRATADPAEVFASDDVDAVIVASPTSTHVDLIRQAIDSGTPVLCEKPIDLDLSRVDAVRDLARASATPIALGFNRRFDPHFAELHRRVASGEIGALEHLAITSRDPEPPPTEYVRTSGGIFRDMTIHDFDMARFFVPDIVSVEASGLHQFSDEIRDAGDYDAAVVILRGASGQSIVITNSRHSSFGYDQRLEAVGPDGMLQVGNIADTVVTHYSRSLVEARQPYQTFFLQRYAEAYRLELVEFMKAVRGEASTSPTFEDGRAALVLADAATRSARDGGPVAVDLAS